MLALVPVLAREANRSPAMILSTLATAFGPTIGMLVLDAATGSDGRFLRASAPAIVPLIGLLVPFALLAAPIVAWRERGTLRLIATTTAREGGVVIAGVVAATLGTVIAVCVPISLVSALRDSTGLVLLSAAAAVALGLAVAALVAAFATSAVTARAIALLAPALAVLSSSAMPWQHIAPGVAPLIAMMPTAVIGRALDAGPMNNDTTAAPLAAIVVGSVALILIAIRAATVTRRRPTNPFTSAPRNHPRHRADAAEPPRLPTKAQQTHRGH